MEIFTIGFAQTPAAEFFGKLKRAGIGRLLDVRLNNTSQLAAFAKRDDLQFFLREICGVRYEHEPLLAPTQPMLDAYKKHKGSWQDYEEKFLELMAERRIEQNLDHERFATTPTVLLCSERTADHCHRRLVLEYLAAKWPNVAPVHL
ncbi:MAG: DUF488 domain-containing protein [Planctomycetes bacterium]|nr:DUF488 domain-containing protein [Planctomycetota bacterium]